MLFFRWWGHNKKINLTFKNFFCAFQWNRQFSDIGYFTFYSNRLVIINYIRRLIQAPYLSRCVFRIKKKIQRWKTTLGFFMKLAFGEVTKQFRSISDSCYKTLTVIEYIVCSTLCSFKNSQEMYLPAIRA